MEVLIQWHIIAMSPNSLYLILHVLFWFLCYKNTNKETCICTVFHGYMIIHNGIHYNECKEFINSSQFCIISTKRSSHQIEFYVLVKWNLLIQEDQSGWLELTTSHHDICSVMLHIKTITFSDEYWNWSKNTKHKTKDRVPRTPRLALIRKTYGILQSRCFDT